MKKIPTLFERQFENHRIVQVLPTVSPELEWVLAGEGHATIKWDGACCAIIGGKFYKRYDAKHGKPVPSNAIKCQEEADPVTGHLPCWVPCNRSDPADRWFWAAFDRAANLPDATYEAIGPHFKTNPHGLSEDILKLHGMDVVDVERSFEGIRSYLERNNIEGIVFWKDGEPKCKIKRRDFGYPWPDLNPSNSKGLDLPDALLNEGAFEDNYLAFLEGSNASPEHIAAVKQVIAKQREERKL